MWIVLASVVRAIAVSSSILSTAASSPGFTTVLTWTSWSYCLYTHFLLAIFGEDKTSTIASFKSGCLTETLFSSSGISLSSRSIEGGSAKRIVGKLANYYPSSIINMLSTSVNYPINAKKI